MDKGEKMNISQINDTIRFRDESKASFVKLMASIAQDVSALKQGVERIERFHQQLSRGEYEQSENFAEEDRKVSEICSFPDSHWMQSKFREVLKSYRAVENSEIKLREYENDSQNRRH